MFYAQNACDTVDKCEHILTVAHNNKHVDCGLDNSKHEISTLETSNSTVGKTLTNDSESDVTGQVRLAAARLQLQLLHAVQCSVQRRIA